MTRAEVDSYLQGLDEPKRSTLEDLRAVILECLPGVEECISYGMPAFRIRGKVIAGFSAFKNHLSYLPHSGSVLPELARETDGYVQTKGSLHFAVDVPLPNELVAKLVAVRLSQAFPNPSV
jgi:uncharacterized protein YdhG (YjbR/CyaY superfamily)